MSCWTYRFTRNRMNKYKIQEIYSHCKKKYGLGQYIILKYYDNNSFTEGDL